MWKKAKAMALQLEGMKENMTACICGTPRERMEGCGLLRSWFTHINSDF